MKTFRRNETFVPCPLCGSASSAWATRAAGDIHWCQDRLCSLKFVSPQPSEEQLASAYSSFYYPGGAGSSDDRVFHQTPIEIAERVARAVSQRFRIRWDRANVLDFGCGEGACSSVFAGQGATVWGIELNDHARGQAASVLDGRVFATLADLRRREPEVEFTFVFMEQVIEHVRDPILALSELRSLARNDCILYIGTPNAGGANAKLFGSRWREMQNPTHLWFFNWPSLQRLLYSAGWREPRRLIKGLRYPDSGIVRGLVQYTLGWVGLEGALRVTAQPSGRSSVD